MKRRLAAVLVTDIAGYSRMMEADEVGALDRITTQFEQVIKPELDRSGGRIVKTTGDGFLAEFPSVVDAVRCALRFQQSLSEPQQDPAEAVRYRVGINIGDVILQDDDIFGDGVNVAARLEAIAPVGGLCISELVWQNLRGEVSDVFQDIGTQHLKNIERQIRAWKWPVDENAAPILSPPDKAARGKATLSMPPLRHSPRDTSAEDFATGLQDDAHAALDRLDTLRMLGPDQHATYVITGNLRTANGQIRCNLTLRNTQTDDTLWTQRFDGALAEGFDLQDRITDALIGAVEIEVSDGLQARRWRAEAGNADAYDLFRDGRAAYKDYARPANLRARKQFEQALTLAPGFLSAAVGLARTHIEDATFGWSNDRERSLTHARDALDGVLSINPDHSAAHAERSHLLMVSGEYFEGLLAAELAVALDPDDADAHNCRAYLLNCVGRYRDALASVQRSLALNPSGPEFYLQPMLYARLALGQYEDAISIADRILERRTKWLTAHALKIAALEGAGRHDDAVLAVNTLHGIRARFGISDWQKILHNPTEAAIPRMAGFLKQAGMPD